MKEGLWIVNEQGKSEFVFYDEIDPDVLSQLWKPIGGFCYAADDFMRLSLPSVPFYIKDWLPKPGKIVVYGQAKAGKSFLTYQLARCIGSGIPFLEIPTTQGKVLIVQFEIGASVFQWRLRQSGRGYGNVFVGTSFTMKLDSEAGQQMLIKALQAIQPDVVILDPFYKLLRGEEKESHDVLAVFDFLDEMIEAFDCSFIIMCHPGKDLQRGARGSSVLEDYPDAYIEMKRVPPKTELRIKLTPKLLRHAELPPEPIEAVLTNFEFERVGDKPTVKAQVRKYLEHFKTATGGELVDAKIGSRKAVYDAISSLVNEAVIVRAKRGVYEWIGGG